MKSLFSLLGVLM